MKAKTKKIALSLFAGLAVIGILFVVGLVVLIRGSSEHLPQITAYADGRTIEVEPFRYCPVNQPLCSFEGSSSQLPVRPGHPLQLSLPKPIFSSPWVLAAVYADAANKDVVETDTFYAPGKQLHVTVMPTDKDGRALAGVEVRLPTGVIDPDTNQEEIISHAIWSIATTK